MRFIFSILIGFGKLVCDFCKRCNGLLMTLPLFTIAWAEDQWIKYDKNEISMDKINDHDHILNNNYFTFYHPSLTHNRYRLIKIC